MKTITLEELQRTPQVEELDKLDRKLGTLAGFRRVLLGLPTRAEAFRAQKALLTEIEALDAFGRNVVWGLLPTEHGLACFDFRYEALVRGVFSYLDRIDPDFDPDPGPATEVDAG